MQPDADILIAGGGPAGLAAGIRAAQRGLDAVILEPEPAPIDKACGEGLMPAALDQLETLGVDPEALEGYPFRGVRYLDARDPRIRATGEFPSAAGKGVRRLELHRVLAERADELGVEQCRRRVREPEVIDDAGVKAAGLCGRYLVGADGLHSTVRRKLGVEVDERGTARYGIRRHFRLEPWTDRVEVHWSGEAEAYVTPVGPETIGVAMLFEEAGRYEELLDSFPILRRRLAGAEPVTDQQGGGPFDQRVQHRVVERVLLVGDAAGYVDPLTGEGVALAVETACAAVDAIADGEADRYEDEWRRRTREYFWLTGGLLTLTRPRWTHQPLISLLDRVPGLFDWVLGRLGG